MSLLPKRSISRADCLCFFERVSNKFAQLVYLDPPWYERRAELLSGTKAKKGLDAEGQTDQYASQAEYAGWLELVMQQAHRVCADEGNVVVHANPVVEHIIRTAVANFMPHAQVSRIPLAVSNPRLTNSVPVDNQNSFILIRKSSESIWNAPMRPQTEEEIARKFKHVDERGRYYFLSDITVPTVNHQRMEWRGISPPSGRAWRFSLDRLNQLESEGRLLIQPDRGVVRYKVYADEQADIAIGMNWSDVPLVVPSQERTARPGQQPLAILERLINATTNLGDVVLDAMCGSGTTLVAAEMLGRLWIGSDIDDKAIDISRSRVKSVMGDENPSFFDVDTLPVVRDSVSLPRSAIYLAKTIRFVHNKPIPLEETRQYEFKEVKGASPVNSIKNNSDEYAVAFLNSDGGRILWGVRNEDRLTVGVRLTYRDRDEVAKAIDNKLSEIQPPLPQSSWKIDFFPVYDGDSAVQDLYVVQLLVPRPVGNIGLYATGSSEVFVKTSSGKKKLSWQEIQVELLNRMKSEK